MSIQKEAFAQGKLADKTWMAGLASTRIAGRALKWYSQQSEEITSDWVKLRASVIDEYCKDLFEPSTTIPSTIQAPPVSSPADPGNNSWFAVLPFPLWKAKATPASSDPTRTKGHDIFTQTTKPALFSFALGQITKVDW
ncbi:hypothetical protein FRC00_002998 [Tulasnella sp. 408]|nr:hypothetical protein FRC00_002998 [Tulasnella sp. 408]